MQELEDRFGELTGKELHLRGWIHDWYWDETQEGSAVVEIVQDGVNVKVVGRKIRTFKPEVPFMIYVSTVIQFLKLYIF